MTAHAPVNPAPLFFNLDECPPALDGRGRARWAELYGLQLHIRHVALRRECDTWKSLAQATRETEVWDELCRDADRKLAAEAGCNRESPEVLRARRLLDADASIERCWVEINAPRNRPTSQAIIEAILCAVRDHGVGALEELKIVSWLSECDIAAKAEIDRRIAAKDMAR